MPYEFYRTLHFAGIIFLFGGLIGGLIAGLALSATKTEFTGQARKMAFLTHGLGMALMLVSGFGMAAKLGYFGDLPNWIYSKLVIWLLLGLAMSLAKRKAQLGWPLLVLFSGLGMTAIFIAVNKPI